MINYVKFRRGTPQAYATLKENNAVEQDTLYFIYSESGDTADLYLGTKLISSGENDLGATIKAGLEDLAGVAISEPSAGDLLIYNESTEQWENRSAEEILNDYSSNQTNIIFIKNENDIAHEELIQQEFLTLIPVIGSIVVIEDKESVFTTYLYTGDKWMPICSSESDTILKIDEKQFSFDDENKLCLKGFDSAQSGNILTINENGEIDWVAPIDAYSKEEVDIKLSSLGKLQRVIVSTVDEINNYFNKEDYSNYIFMKLSTDEETTNKYDEYIILEVEGEKIVEKIGTWETDLSNYYDKTNGILAQDVKDLNDWLKENGSTTINNIGVNNLEKSFADSLITTQSFNQDHFVVSDNIVSLKHNYVTIDMFNQTVGDLDTLLDNQVNLYNEILDIKDSLTWRDIEND